VNVLVVMNVETMTDGDEEVDVDCRSDEVKSEEVLVLIKNLLPCVMQPIRCPAKH
jgi:hypothetical protein